MRKIHEPRLPSQLSPPARRLGLPVTLMAVLLMVGGAVPSGSASDSPPEADAAFLFAYRPHTGQEEAFRAGYRRHLDWHREHQDPLVWYGWMVLTGERPGLFVDGVFGIPFSALDRRVDPAGDAADLAENVTPYGGPIFRTALRLRRDLSTATRLESHDPSLLVTVAWVHLKPGMDRRFAEVLRKLKAAATPSAVSEPPSEYTWYELVSGGAEPMYLLMLPAGSITELGARPSTLSRLVGELLHSGEAEAAREELAATVHEIFNETWRYLPVLSYFPDGDSADD